MLAKDINDNGGLLGKRGVLRARSLLQNLGAQAKKDPGFQAGVFFKAISRHQNRLMSALASSSLRNAAKSC